MRWSSRMTGTIEPWALFFFEKDRLNPSSWEVDFIKTLWHLLYSSGGGSFGFVSLLIACTNEHLKKNGHSGYQRFQIY